MRRRLRDTFYGSKEEWDRWHRGRAGWMESEVGGEPPYSPLEIRLHIAIQTLLIISIPLAVVLFARILTVVGK